MKFRLMARSDWQRIRDYVAGLPKIRNGKQVCYQVAVEEIKSTRSVEQNARYWSLLTAISQQAPQHMGGVWHHPDVWHEYCASRFLGVEAGPYGHGVRKSTRRLKVAEFGEYMQQIEAWAYTELPGFNFEYQEAA